MELITLTKANAPVFPWCVSAQQGIVHLISKHMNQSDQTTRQFNPLREQPVETIKSERNNVQRDLTEYISHADNLAEKRVSLTHMKVVLNTIHFSLGKNEN